MPSVVIAMMPLHFIAQKGALPVPMSLTDIWQAEEVESAEAMAEEGLQSAGKASRPAPATTSQATGLPLQCQVELCHAFICSKYQLHSAPALDQAGSSVAASYISLLQHLWRICTCMHTSVAASAAAPVSAASLSAAWCGCICDCCCIYGCVLLHL